MTRFSLGKKKIKPADGGGLLVRTTQDPTLANFTWLSFYVSPWSVHKNRAKLPNERNLGPPSGGINRRRLRWWRGCAPRNHRQTCRGSGIGDARGSVGSPGKMGKMVERDLQIMGFPNLFDFFFGKTHQTTKMEFDSLRYDDTTEIEENLWYWDPVVKLRDLRRI